MARIPDEELQRIKSQVAVEDLCRDYGIELQPHGAGQPHGPVPVPRRPDAELRRDPLEEPVELPGRVRRRRRDRTGHGSRTSPSARRWTSCGSDWASCPKTRPSRRAAARRTRCSVPASETELADHVLLKHVLDFYHQTFLDDLKAMRYLQSRAASTPRR